MIRSQRADDVISAGRLRHDVVPSLVVVGVRRGAVAAPMTYERAS